MGKVVKKILDNLFGWAALIGLLALPVVVLLALAIHRNIVGGKQVTMDRAKLSLTRALEDYKTAGGNFQAKRYGYFQILPCSNNIVIGGTNYQGVLVAATSFQFRDQSCLNITTNGVFFLLSYDQSSKIIPNNYRVPNWRTGY
jgi:hypothetical protein